MGRGGWQGLGAAWEQLLPVEGLLYQGWAILLLAWQTEEPLLISGALGWLVQVVAGTNPALTAGGGHLLSRGESRTGSRTILRGERV